MDVKLYPCKEHCNDNLSAFGVDCDIPSNFQPITFPGKEGDEKFCLRFIEHGNDFKAKTGYYIGIDWIDEGKSAIQVNPKVNNEVNQTDYLKMLSVAMTNPKGSDYVNKIYTIKQDLPSIPINRSDDLLTPLLVIQYINVLKEIVRKGLKKSYHRVQRNLHSRVKGKVLVSATIKENMLKNRMLKTKCEFDTFDENNLENRLLKKALSFSKRYLTSKKIKLDREKINYINPAFERVSEEVSLSEMKFSKPNPFYKEYKEGLKLAKLILKRFGYNINKTAESKISTPPFWIDMSLLFELYAYSLLREKYGAGVHYQVKGSHSTELDFIINTENESYIADTKYKKVYRGESVNINDIRQVSGYARDNKILKHLNCEQYKEGKKVPECLIIYPDTNQSKKEYGSFGDIEEIDQFVKFKKQSVKLPLVFSQ